MATGDDDARSRSMGVRHQFVRYEGGRRWELCMFRKLAVTLVALVLVGACVWGAGTLAEPDTALLAIEADSPCPATACASGECHGFDAVPEPDGVHEMQCPEASCSSVECHAWDSLVGRYHQASDASLNVWILMPVALVVGLILLMRALSKGGGDEGNDVQLDR